MPFSSVFGMNCDKYYCGKCKEEVCDDDKAIQCEGSCQLWYHANCEAIDDREYSRLSTSDDKWECSMCRKSGLPTFNSLDAVDVFHFDFQRNLPTPKLTVGQQFYMRLLWTYLFAILFSIYQDNDGLYVA